MSNRPGLFVALIAATFLIPAPTTTHAADDTWSVPRTPDGRPDLQGVWANNSATPLQRPDALADKARLTDAEVAELRARAAKLFDGESDAAFADSVFHSALAADAEHESYDPTTGNYNHFWVAERDFDNRTSLIVDPPDGKLPALTPEEAERAQARLARRKEHPADSYVDRANPERCITYGVPFLFAGYNGYFQIVQTPQHVVVVQEMIHDARIIPLDGRPQLDANVQQWIGDPRGHWDGDTLVVETRNFSPNSKFIANVLVPGGEAHENLHLTERFTRVGPETLKWEVTIDDPTIWTKPWTALVRLMKSEGDIFEYACHEGNYAMEGILAGHRGQEAATGAEGGE